MEHKDMKTLCTYKKSNFYVLRTKSMNITWRVGDNNQGHGTHSIMGQDLKNVMEYASISSDLNDHCGLTVLF
jgi:hypothetical protein